MGSTFTSHFLQLDSTSMRQIMQVSNNDPEKVKRRILQIVSERGKMHNPVTNSGGVLLGTVKDIGRQLLGQTELRIGQTIVPLCSISALPLVLFEVKSFSGDLVKVKGMAVMNAKCRFVSPPPNMSDLMLLAAIDVSRAVPLLWRTVCRLLAQRKPNQRLEVLVIGCGKAGITCISCLKTYFPHHLVRILVIDVNPHFLQIAKTFIDEQSGDIVEKVDATNVGEVLRFVQRHTGGTSTSSICQNGLVEEAFHEQRNWHWTAATNEQLKSISCTLAPSEGEDNAVGADLVLNCVNVENVEASSIVATKHRGTVLFFSMATRFDKAALGTDGVAKDIDLLIGGGVYKRQAEMMLHLLRSDTRLLHFLKQESEQNDLDKHPERKAAL
jgi:L-erythro-3,5-diaminohexanoate dehydrogenase